MRLKLRKLNIDAGRPVVFLHVQTARNLNVHIGDRVEVSSDGKKIISTVDIIKGLINPDEVSLSSEIIKYENLKQGGIIDINLIANRQRASLISKKMQGKELSKAEIYAIIKDIVDNALTEAEIAYFVSAVHEKGMSLKETIFLIDAIYKTGYILKWGKNKKIADKHSIGGVAGNRTTPIIVSICAASGIIMPKTSSRAITSAAGTADTIETIAKVELPARFLKKIVEKTGACLAWGGALSLAPADDKLIRVEKLLNLDPESQLIASIMAKKLAVGSRYVLIDIPYGPGSKVSRKEAEKLRKKFLYVGKHFNLHVKVVLTDGSQPIGNGIGPVLEMLDVLKVLNRAPDAPKDLENKSLMLSAEILEMLGKAKKGSGLQMARQILISGSAFKKFNEIIDAQGRRNSPLKIAKYSFTIKAEKSGKIRQVDNKILNKLARVLGCPADKGSGLYLFKHKHDGIKKDEPLLTLYSESQKKLREAVYYFKSEKPILY